MTLRTRLIVAFFLLSVVPLGALTYYSYASNAKALRDAAEREADLLADELGQRMQLVTAQLTQRLEFLMDISQLEDELERAAEQRTAVTVTASTRPVETDDLGVTVAKALGDAAVWLSNVELRDWRQERGRGARPPGSAGGAGAGGRGDATQLAARGGGAGMRGAGGAGAGAGGTAPRIGRDGRRAQPPDATTPPAPPGTPPRSGDSRAVPQISPAPAAGSTRAVPPPAVTPKLSNDPAAPSPPPAVPPPPRAPAGAGAGCQRQTDD